MGITERRFGPWEVRMEMSGHDAGGLPGGANMTVRPVGAEKKRLEEDVKRVKNWKRWGPYLSERQWGTVREDYSPGG